MPDASYAIAAEAADLPRCGDIGASNSAPRLFLTLSLSLNALAIGCAITAAIVVGLPADAFFKEGSFITTFSAAQIVAMAAVCLWIFHHRREDESAQSTHGGRWLWLLLALGAGELALDEAAAFHEFADQQIHQLLSLRETPWTDRIDDLIVLSYGAAALWVLYLFRAELRRCRAARPLFVLGFGLFFAMAALDVLTNSYAITPATPASAQSLMLLNAWVNAIEDSFKLFSEGAFIAAFAVIALSERASLPR